jgi:hypothetical protein
MQAVYILNCVGIENVNPERRDLLREYTDGSQAYIVMAVKECSPFCFVMTNTDAVGVYAKQRVLHRRIQTERSCMFIRDRTRPQ